MRSWKRRKRQASGNSSRVSRSEEHTSELQSHRDLHSFPTRRSSDLDTASEARSRGAGTLAMNALMEAAEEAGFWKLVARVFVENKPSRKLLLTLGFREVGIHEKHARLDGVWRDVVVIERLLAANL